MRLMRFAWLVFGTLLLFPAVVSADGPDEIQETRTWVPSPTTSLSKVLAAPPAARDRSSRMGPGEVVTLGGYGNMVLEASSWSPLDPNAYHWFYTNIFANDSWIPPQEHVRLTSGEAHPRWYGTSPWNPYQIQYTARWECAGGSIAVSFWGGGVSWTSGGTAVIQWLPVQGNWMPDFFYPSDTVTCSGFNLSTFNLSTFRQTDTVQFQFWATAAPLLVVATDAETIGLF
ncbi:hypothetical protein [Tepidiforma sp.]|uniref:hypothetical protein n=1 Tax=Tepidiforma sp. TaxID=2682230 RepID=UPI002605F1E5|nr:hypothetical protein [Tepidiforma sp.]MCX7619001.1 hypothetical protein [Tepidiforma sp.]